MKNIDYLPRIPVISRYSAPWDADGWYYTKDGLNKGDNVSSNIKSDIKKIKGKYVGSEYIVTYDSKMTKKIDHQENDFYIERDATIYVCIDKQACDDNNLPSWLNSWVQTKDTIETSNGIYVLFFKNYEKDEHIIIPAFEGNYHNYFIIAQENNGKRYKEEKVEIRRSSTDPFTIGYHEKKNYESYLACTFNDDSYMKIFEINGKTTIVENEFFAGKKQLKLEPDSNVKYILPHKDTSIDVRTSIDYRGGTFGVYGFLVDNGQVYYQNKYVCDIEINNISTFHFIITNPYSGIFKAFINNLEIDGVFRTKSPYLFDVESFTSIIYVQNLYVADYTEEYIINEHFDGDKCPWTILDGEKSIVSFPYENNKSLLLKSKNMGSCELTFEGITSKAYIEQRVFISNDGFTGFSIFDEEANLIATCAFYKNNVFANDGSDWCRELGYVTPHTYYPKGNWYDVKFIIDMKKKTYELFIDGASLVKNRKFASRNVKSVCKVEYVFSEGSDLYINFVKVYTGCNSGRSLIDGKIFDVRSYGAVGDGITNDTNAIQKAIDECGFTGGSVVLSNGVFLTGELKLKSDMTLYISDTAVLLGSQNHFDYPLREPSRSLCANRQLGRGLIYADKVTNVTIKGGGMLDGNGKYRFKENDPLSDRRALDARPDIIYITQSIGIIIEDLNLRRSAFWTVVPLTCENVRINNLHLDCQNTPNRDGIDPVDCRYITISNCNIMAGDDGICFKSSDTYGCENIEVHNCMIQSLASAIKYGTDTYYSLKNAVFRDCFIKNVNRCAISLESVDGAEVDNVKFVRLDCTDCASPAYVVTGSRNRLPKNYDVVRKSTIENILFSQINARNPRTFGHPLPISEVMVIGESADQLIKNITFENCDFEVLGGVREHIETIPEPIGKKYPEFDRHGLSSGYAFTFMNTKGIKIENVKVRKQKEDVREKVVIY